MKKSYIIVFFSGLLFLCTFLLISCQQQAQPPFAAISSLLPEDVPLEITLLSSREHHSIFIKTQNDLIMIDSDLSRSQPNAYYFLKEYGIETIDVLVLTHLTASTLNELDLLTQELSIDQVIIPPDAIPVASLHAPNIRQSTSSLTQDDIFSFTLSLDEVTLNFHQNPDDSSLMVSLEYHDTNFLFAGHVEPVFLQDFLVSRYGRFEVVTWPQQGFDAQRLKHFNHPGSSHDIIACNSSLHLNEAFHEYMTENSPQLFSTRQGSIHILMDGEQLVFTQQIHPLFR